MTNVNEIDYRFFSRTIPVKLPSPQLVRWQPRPNKKGGTTDEHQHQPQDPR